MRQHSKESKYSYREDEPLTMWDTLESFEYINGLSKKYELEQSMGNWAYKANLPKEIFTLFF